MRILFFGDTHGNKAHLRTIMQKSHDVDVIVCVGDFTIFENGADDILRQLNSAGKPVIIIPGNHESSSMMINLSMNHKNIHNIHKTYHIIDDIIFFGYGGGGFSTVDNKFDIVADNFLKELKNLEKKNNMEYKIVLVTHPPPYNTNIDYIGEHVGCKNFRKFIEEQQPIISVSGHIHETFGFEDTIGKTLVFNPGPDGRIIKL
jgi:Icc-related predicted phosphoesterase